MQVTNNAALPNTRTGTTSSDAPIQDAAAQDSGPMAGTPPTNAASSIPTIPSATVSLSSAAQAYLSQPDPPSLAEIQREKKKPKMKTLLEHMLEWSRKYEEQRDQAQKAKQLAPVQNKNAGKAALTALAPLSIKKGADRTETE